MRRAALAAASGLLWGLHVPLRWLARQTGRGSIALARRAALPAALPEERQ